MIVRRAIFCSVGLLVLISCASSPNIANVDCGVRRVHVEVSGATQAGSEFKYLLERELQERGFTVTSVEESDATLSVGLRTNQQFRASSSHSGVGSGAGSGGTYAGSHASSGTSSAYSFTESYVLAELHSRERGEIWKEYFQPGGILDISEKLAA